MRKLTCLVCILFLVTVVISLTAYAVNSDGKLTTTWGKIKNEGSSAKAAPPEDVVVEAKPVRALPVGPGVKMWVFVFPEKGGKGKKPPPDGGGPSPYCDDGEQGTPVPNFADANPDGLTFNINDSSIPIDKSAAIGAIRASFDAWDAVDIESYFTISGEGGASRPEMDENNTVGWVRIVPRSALAAAWVWTDENDTVTQADIFFNAFHEWGVFATCDAEGKFEVGNVGTHEVGHVVGLDHLGANVYPTMYPSASKGEVRKRTLTDGDKSGYTAARGY